MLVTPSNSAIDEIIERILYNGLFDFKDNTRNIKPNIIRLGTSENKAVSEVCIENIVTEESVKHFIIEEGKIKSTEYNEKEFQTYKKAFEDNLI